MVQAAEQLCGHLVRHTAQSFPVEVAVSPRPDRRGMHLKSRVRELSLEQIAITPPAAARLAPGQLVSLWPITQPGNYSPQRQIQARVTQSDPAVVRLRFERMGLDVLPTLRGLLEQAKYF